jgi:hypothetical protein
MQTSTLAIKTGTLYAACSPEWGMVSYGVCWEEAVNNLAEDIRQHERNRRKRAVSAIPDLTGYERNQS